MKHVLDRYHLMDPIAENDCFLDRIILNFSFQHIQFCVISFPAFVVAFHEQQLRIRNTLSHPHELLEKLHAPFSVSIGIVCLQKQTTIFDELVI
ncbi:hypothetical protein AR158_C664R [Paramecium bursaria Chlorella virus AR158]|uniref:hypothetical protein n=1 Tax=Paramecium bursaria Chlorella virus AR158 TaxID=380598 RepID=UPI00015AA82B|nr:hypothetical protein AR158_C664R [Paramecium bursaria Chlorella virus AR158]ABU44209.1 hypothetical protein AR158_C664R [Paramecium bursaria Chlorella virus AR158]